MSSGFGFEKVPTTEGWLWIVFGSCVANFIAIPIFLFILVRIHSNLNGEDRIQTFQHKFILISSIGYLLSLFAMSLAQFVTFYPYRWGIKPSPYICAYVKRPEITFIALTHYFFYQFCLFRINNTFHKSPKLQLKSWQFIALQIIIHGYLLYHGVIFQWIVQMQPHKIFGFCYAIQKDSDIHVGISIVWDALTVFILIYIFSSKLICGMQRDESLSWFKTKTLILGIMATFSSLMVTVLFFLGRMNRFVFVLDGFFNACCIVFTYNMRYVSLPFENKVQCPSWFQCCVRCGTNNIDKSYSRIEICPDDDLHIVDTQQCTKSNV